MRLLAGCLALLCSHLALAEAPAAIGRLFAPAGGDPSARTDGSIRVDGAVVRSSGRNTVWLNGQARTEGDGKPGGARASAARLPEVALEGKGSIRIGETVALESGKRRDLLPENAMAKGR